MLKTIVYLDRPCDICKEDDADMSRECLPIVDTSFQETGFYSQSNICSKCQTVGWRLSRTLSRNLTGNICYINVKTTELKVK